VRDRYAPVHSDEKFGLLPARTRSLEACTTERGFVGDRDAPDLFGEDLFPLR
jgi:hypothetical protein